jgi:hypothetical protein
MQAVGLAGLLIAICILFGIHFQASKIGEKPVVQACVILIPVCSFLAMLAVFVK